MGNQKIAKLENNSLIKWSNAITESSHSMSATEQNVMYMLISQLRDDDPGDKMYSIPVIELEKMSNSQVNYSHLKEASQKLIGQVYKIRIGNELTSFAPLNYFLYRKGSGRILLQLSDGLRPFFFALKNNYTLFQFQMALKLKSKYAKRIYEMLSQFKSTGVWKISVRELKERFGLIDPETGKEEYPNFNLFATYVLKPAYEEINAYTDITFDYTTKKTGRKITHLEFKIRSKKVLKELSASTTVAPQVSSLEERLVSECKISKVLARDVVKVFSAEKIEWVIKGILRENEAGKIKKLGAYSTKIFEQWINGAEPTFEKTTTTKKHIPLKSFIQTNQIAAQEHELEKKLSKLGLGRKKVYGLIVKYGGGLESLEKLEVVISGVEESIEKGEIERNPEAIFEVINRNQNGEEKQFKQPLVSQSNERSNSMNAIESLVQVSLPSPKMQAESADEEKIRREKTGIWEELIGRFRLDDEEADVLVEEYSVEALKFAISKIVEALKNHKIPEDPVVIAEELRKYASL